MNKILKNLGIEQTNSGSWQGPNPLQSGNDDLIESINPSNGKVIATVANTTIQEYESIIKNAQDSFLEWQKVPPPLRGDVVRRIGNALRDYKDDLGSLISLENGKIKSEGDGEVQEMIDMADFAVGQSRMLYGKTMHSERPSHRMYEQWHPLGLVGTITAFNFPVAVWSWNSFIAAICGNISIWKPSPKTPLCGIAIQNICGKVISDFNLPNIFNLINDQTNSLSQKLIDDRRIDLLSFTGSSFVGKKVGNDVSARMGKYLLELGGNNAIIVDRTANLNIAIPGIVFGSVGTAGQRCTTTRRVLVHTTLMEDIKKRLVKAYKQIRIGDPLDPKTLMGPLIDERSIKNVESAISQIKKLGGEILTGGNRIQGPGYFIEPILAVAKNEWGIVQEETFGPILYLIPFNDIDDAIAKQNNVSQGLSSSIFTNDVQNMEKFLSSGGSDCGIANVNIGTSGAEIGGAFGGEKETGGGREAGSDAWKGYMRRQTNTINWGSDMPLAQGVNFDI